MEVTIVRAHALPGVGQGTKTSSSASRRAARATAPNASTIKWVIDDGIAEVKEGDKLCELDDSGFQDQLKTQRNTVNKAKADWVQATTDITIQQIENVSRIKTAEVNLIQKRLDLKKYTGEVAGSKIDKFETQEQVRSYLFNEFEKDARRNRMKGGEPGKFTSGFQARTSASTRGASELGASDATDDWMDRSAWSPADGEEGLLQPQPGGCRIQSRLESMKIALRKAEGDRDIYRIFDREKKVTTCWSDVKEAERSLDKETKQADANLEQKKAIEAADKLILEQETDRLNDMLKDEKLYTMYSPQKGMVVYYIPEQAQLRQRLPGFDRRPGRAGPRKPKADSHPDPVQPDAGQRSRSPRSDDCQGPRQGI